MTLSSLFTNVDVLTVGIAASAIAIMGFVVYLNDRHNRTAQAFLFFALMTILWNISNVVQYQFSTIATTLIAMRVNLFLATWHAFSFFVFAHTFPQVKVSWRTRTLGIALMFTTITSLLTLTPFVFSGIEQLAPSGLITDPNRGTGIVLFAVITLGLLSGGIISLLAKLRRSAESLERRRLLLVLVGMSLTALLILLFSMLLPVFFSDLTYLPYSALFFLPFLGLLSYTIYRYRLFSMKVMAVQTLTYVLGVLAFGEVLTTTDAFTLIFRIVLLIAVVIAGILLTRSVTKEVEQRELIEEQRKELETANRQQESLLHFISHEIKGYLTDGQNAFASIVEGDAGVVPLETRTFAQRALTKMRQGVQTVMEILEASNMKLGTVTYKKEPFDLRPTVEGMVEFMRPRAAEHGLAIDISVDMTKQYRITGDKDRLSQHVIRNLIDNAIRYTPKGSVHVTLTRSGSSIHFSVKDTGIGITEDDHQHLFTEGGRGKNSVKVNPDSTGYGLFIAKRVVEDHGGSIRAESTGPGAGSEFIVELPAA